jgi:hypothetical protein
VTWVCCVLDLCYVRHASCGHVYLKLRAWWRHREENRCDPEQSSPQCWLLQSECYSSASLFSALATRGSYGDDCADDFHRHQVVLDCNDANIGFYEKVLLLPLRVAAARPSHAPPKIGFARKENQMALYFK